MSGGKMNTFWSLLIEPGKTYERTVESGIHVTRCALDTAAVKSESDEGLVQVILEHCGQASTVANLSVKHSIFQTDLDLFFQCGEEVSFTTSGVKVPVTLTGLCGVDLGEPESDSDDDDYEEGSCDDTIDETFEADDDVDALGKRKITKTSGTASKKSKLSALNDVTLASDSDSDDEHYNPVADDSSMLVDEAEDIETEETDSEQDDDSDLSDDEDEEESDDDDDEVVLEEETVVEESPVKSKKAKKSLDSKTIKTLKAKVASPEQKSTPKPSKVEKLKNKEANKSQNSTPLNVSKAKMSNGKENKDGKNTKGEKKLKEPEAKGTPKSEKKKKNKQILSGSVTSEDIVAGNGKVAKNNSMVSLYYDGRFKSGKVLDQCLSGKPFKFRLGKGEVIKGWDVGVAGMKEGGKRKLCIPAAMAYGSKGMPGAIPPNSDLVFDVTLLKVL